jgi:hypothetical protein
MYVGGDASERDYLSESRRLVSTHCIYTLLSTLSLLKQTSRSSNYTSFTLCFVVFFLDAFPLFKIGSRVGVRIKGCLIRWILLYALLGGFNCVI